MTKDGFWAELKTAGITKSGRLNERQFVGESRTGEVVYIPDPELLSDEQREAAVVRIKSLYGDTCH